jgi:WD40 repeat protein
LLPDPPRLLTHNGWVSMDGSAVEMPDAAWVRSLESQARFAERGGPGGALCVQTHGGEVQLWNAGADASVVVPDVEGLRGVRAAEAGCLIVADSGVDLLFARGDRTRRRLVEGSTDALGVGPQTVLVAQGESLRVFDATGEKKGDLRVGVGVTALAPLPEAIAVGYADGTVNAIAPGTGQIVTDSFEDLPSGRITTILAGPTGTVIVGYADGNVGLWSLDGGQRLAHGRLHGPIVHLQLEGEHLYIATDLGRFAVWDLTAFYEDYCDLLRGIWQRVPTTWEAGRPLAHGTPEGHPCTQR